MPVSLQFSNKKILSSLAFVLAAMSSLVFLPGISGPFVFDDFSNITGNKFLRFDELNLSNLYQAAMSSNAGTLKRPLAMLTFALNSWFAGGMNSAEPFKVWNLVIHSANSILILMLTVKIIGAASVSINKGSKSAENLIFRYPLFFAMIIAVLWAVHPIQLTSILYVVQRMTSLSAFFVLLALISYVSGRQYQETSQYQFILYCFLLPAILLILGLVSKENAVLLPVFILSLELTVFSNKPVWGGLKRNQLTGFIFRPWFIIATVSLVTAILVYIFQPGYTGRLFSMPERLLTESRVVATYIYLILAPRLSGFALHHDDVVISQGLLTPPTTLLSIVFLISLIVISWLIRRRLPLISFGIFFFFAGQLLESTFIPLEIMHEHRNYLPSFGLIFAGVAGITALSDLLKNKIILALIPGFLAAFSFTSIVRAGDWSNVVSLYSNEVIHHPKSVRTLIEYSGILNLLHRKDDAMEMVSEAIRLKPDNPILQIELRKYEKFNSPETIAQDERINSLLKNYPLNPFLKLQLESVVECLPTECGQLLNPLEQWLVTIINREKGVNDPSYFMYLLGRTYILQGRGNDAIQAMRASASLDKLYMQPRFTLFSLYIDAGRLDAAEATLKEIKKQSTYGRFKWINEINNAQAILDSRLRNVNSSK
jgi:tetratricopeptide (TPR) repeat protein